MTALGMLINHAGFWITEKRNADNFMDTGAPEPTDTIEG
jgi:hypothetical protein